MWRWAQGPTNSINEPDGSIWNEPQVSLGQEDNSLPRVIALGFLGSCGQTVRKETEEGKIVF